MKIKKVLCLGAVLGAVLSVGMVTSAMAEEATTEAPTEETTLTLPAAIREPHAQLDTIPTVELPAAEVVINSGGNEDDWALNKDILGGQDFAAGTVKEYNNLKIKASGADTKFIRLGSDSYISFKVGEAGCWLTVVMYETGDSKYADAYIYKTDSTGASHDPLAVVLAPLNGCIHLEQGEYFIASGKNGNNSACIEELEFTDYEKELKVYTKGKGQDWGKNTSIAIVSDGTSFYAVAMIPGNHTNPDTASGYNDIKLKGNVDGDQGKIIETIYQAISYNEHIYDYNYFGVPSGNNKGDFYAVVKLTPENSTFDATTAASIRDRLSFEGFPSN